MHSYCTISDGLMDPPCYAWVCECGAYDRSSRFPYKLRYMAVQAWNRHIIEMGVIKNRGQEVIKN